MAFKKYLKITKEEKKEDEEFGEEELQTLEDFESKDVEFLVGFVMI
jgi:hypothetical protein